MFNIFWGTLANRCDDPTDPLCRAVGEMEGWILIVVNSVLGLLGLFAALFFVWIGFKLAKAEDEGKRKEAKKQMIFAIVAVLGIVILIVLWNTVIVDAINTARTAGNCPSGYHWRPAPGGSPPGTPGTCVPNSTR